MANYYGSGRSNYVKVTDIEMIKKIAALYGCSVSFKDEDEASGLVCLLAETEHGDFENYRFPDKDEVKLIKQVWPEAEIDDETFELPDFMKTISKYLKRGYVFIWTHVGNEKLRYLTGYSAAVNSKGQTKCVSITDIYKLAKPMGKHITTAEY